MLIGSAISVITNGIGNAVHDRPFFEGAGMAAITGAVGGAVSFGIGQATMGMTGLDKVVNQAFAHGLLGGSMSSFSGGDFGSGFVSGVFGSLAASGSGALLSNINNRALQSIGMIGSGSLIGGIGSEMSGGEFWDGFRNGGISSTLNHLLHDGPPTLRQLRYRINNSRLARAIVKDFYSVSLDGAVVPGFGASVSTVTVNVLLRGPEKGIFITHAPSNSIGFRGGLSISVQQGTFMGNPDYITRNSLYGRTWSLDSDFLLFPFGVWRGYDSYGEPVWRGTNSSLGFSYGISLNRSLVNPGLPK